MNDNKRRAIVWDKIECLAFHPKSPESWLGVYAKTLHGLWGLEPMWGRFARNDHFDNWSFSDGSPRSNHQKFSFS